MKLDNQAGAARRAAHDVQKLLGPPQVPTFQELGQLQAILPDLESVTTSYPRLKRDAGLGTSMQK